MKGVIFNRDDFRFGDLVGLVDRVVFIEVVTVEEEGWLEIYMVREGFICEYMWLLGIFRDDRVGRWGCCRCLGFSIYCRSL